MRLARATTIASFELRSTVLRLGFLATTFGLPILLGAVTGTSAFVQADLIASQAAATASVGLVDEAGVLGRVRAAFAPIEAAMLLTPEEGAQTQIACATAPGIVGGRYYRDLREAEPNRDALDEAVSRRLWESTANWLSTMPSTESRLT